MPDLGKLKQLKLTTRTREEMAVALPQCWRALRLAGYRRRALIVAFAQAWWRGDLAVDPLMQVAPEPRTIIHARPKSDA